MASEPVFGCIIYHAAFLLRSDSNMSRLLLAALFLPALASAQLAEEYNPPRANCCLPNAAVALANQSLDWNQLGHYHADNAKLMAARADAARVVFMGDSITEFWI